jgi:hypothetical protein
MVNFANALEEADIVEILAEKKTLKVRALVLERLH